MDTEYVLETRFQFQFYWVPETDVGNMTDLLCFPLQCDKMCGLLTQMILNYLGSRTVDGNTQT